MLNAERHVAVQPAEAILLCYAARTAARHPGSNSFGLRETKVLAALADSNVSNSHLIASCANNTGGHLVDGDHPSTTTRGQSRHAVCLTMH